jgi:hypothetical protein
MAVRAPLLEGMPEPILEDAEALLARFADDTLTFIIAFVWPDRERELGWKTRCWCDAGTLGCTAAPALMRFARTLDSPVFRPGIWLTDGGLGFL